jgi:hypothetical protein
MVRGALTANRGSVFHRLQSQPITDGSIAEWSAISGAAVTTALVKAISAAKG